jgi:hypothetical protein
MNAFLAGAARRRHRFNIHANRQSELTSANEYKQRLPTAGVG